MKNIRHKASELKTKLIAIPIISYAVPRIIIPTIITPNPVNLPASTYFVFNCPSNFDSKITAIDDGII